MTISVKWWMNSRIYKQVWLICKAKDKNTLVSGNAGDEKNRHLGGGNFIFFNQYNLIF